MRRRRMLGLLAWALAAPAGAEPMWISLPSKQKRVEIEGQSVTLAISPAFRSLPQLDLRLSIHLADLQAKVPAILAHWAKRKSKKCGLRWEFPQLDPPRFDVGRLWLAGKVRVQQRACAFGTKTRLWRETARFGMILLPSIAGNRLRLAAELEEFDLGNSVLADIGAGTEVHAAVQGALQSALAANDASLGLPKEVEALYPRLTAVELADLGNGNAALVAIARIDADAATLQALVKLLAGL